MLKAKLAMLLTGCALPLALASCQGNLDTDIFFSETISDLDEKAQDYHYLVENCDMSWAYILKADDECAAFQSSYLLREEDNARQARECLLSLSPTIVQSRLKSTGFDRPVTPYSINASIPSSYHVFLYFSIEKNVPSMELYLSNITGNHWAICFRKCVYSITFEEYEKVSSTIDSIFESFNISASEDAAKQDGRWSPSDQSEFRRKGALPC